MHSPVLAVRSVIVGVGHSLASCTGRKHSALQWHAAGLCLYISHLAHSFSLLHFFLCYLPITQIGVCSYTLHITTTLLDPTTVDWSSTTTPIMSEESSSPIEESAPEDLTQNSWATDSQASGSVDYEITLPPTSYKPRKQNDSHPRHRNTRSWKTGIGRIFGHLKNQWSSYFMVVSLVLGLLRPGTVFDTRTRWAQPGSRASSPPPSVQPLEQVEVDAAIILEKSVEIISLLTSTSGHLPLLKASLEVAKEEYLTEALKINTSDVPFKTDFSSITMDLARNVQRLTEAIENEMESRRLLHNYYVDFLLSIDEHLAAWLFSESVQITDNAATYITPREISSTYKHIISDTTGQFILKLAHNFQVLSYHMMTFEVTADKIFHLSTSLEEIQTKAETQSQLTYDTAELYITRFHAKNQNAILASLRKTRPNIELIPFKQHTNVRWQVTNGGGLDAFYPRQSELKFYIVFDLWLERIGARGQDGKEDKLKRFKEVLRSTWESRVSEFEWTKRSIKKQRKMASILKAAREADARKLMK